MVYIANNMIKHSGKQYQAGHEVLGLNKADAERLTKARAVTAYGSRDEAQAPASGAAKLAAAEKALAEAKTQVKEMADQLAKANDQLQELENLKKQNAGGV